MDGPKTICKTLYLSSSYYDFIFKKTVYFSSTLSSHRICFQLFQQQKNTKNPNEMPLKLLSTEVSYVQSVLEETLEEVEESGTFLALRESVAKSRERNKEKNEIG